jgi:LacI family transcriptional regulator
LDYTYESAYQLAVDEIDSWSGTGNFVFAANDEMAAGIIAAANARGIAVPKELGVVGFDDTRVAQMIKPPLTTVRVPMSKMGATAIDLLCRRIADPQRPPARVALNAELVVRESCGSKAHVA